ncbi:PAAR domain-containing protein [Paracoccus ravus]|uniref:PAAR domain-containing protein n=1 Tax=Paracoccus ravus TaxID=2447760 RepID=UPI00106DE5EF|nr:PAAR domain-containing protein [Paracoccus ravus]
MGAPAATQTSQVVGTDIHIVMVPTAGGPVPTPLPHPFAGQIQSATCPTVRIGGNPAATKDSVAVNQPPHIPTPPGTAFQKPPANQGTVLVASMTVKAGGRGIARLGDAVKTCNDPADSPMGSIVSGVPGVGIG